MRYAATLSSTSVIISVSERPEDITFLWLELHRVIVLDMETSSLDHWDGILAIWLGVLNIQPYHSPRLLPRDKLTTAGA